MFILDRFTTLAYSSVSAILRLMSLFAIINFSSGSTQEVLKPNLMQDLDYSLLPKQAWDFLVSIYGLFQGSRPIPRLFNFHSFIVLVDTLLFLFKICGGIWNICETREGRGLSH